MPFPDRIGTCGFYMTEQPRYHHSYTEWGPGNLPKGNMGLYRELKSPNPQIPS
jgi:hypothetical protein